jgi:hypothetical protein
MSGAFEKGLHLAVVCGAVALCNAAAGQDATAQSASRPPPSGDDEIIVYGSIPELRRQLRHTRDSMFLRFNEINSDDRFDIHCYLENPTGSHIKRERCMSNSWREQDANFAQAFVQQIRGVYGVPPEFYTAQQMLWQHKLGEEWLRLASEDAAFAETMKRFDLAREALERVTPSFQAESRKVTPVGGALPYGATRALEVTAGRKPWKQKLDASAFTIGARAGDVHGLRVACEHGNEQLEYQPNSEWTLPSDYGACRLQVDATPGVKFIVYEFE